MGMYGSLGRSLLLYDTAAPVWSASGTNIELLGNKRPVNYGVWRLHNEKFSNVAINLGGMLYVGSLPRRFAYLPGRNMPFSNCTLESIFRTLHRGVTRANL